jgi:NAD(P)-dependent dehydrogenase (short-subunit alcohol dehydrogenase family)
MNARFNGMTVLIAGGTGGLGEAVSLAFLDEGAVVAVTYRNPSGFDALEQAAGSRASRLSGHQADVTDGVALRSLLESLLARHGRLDVLVNAVGGYDGGASLWEADPSSLDRMLALNVRSGYALSRAVAPVMLRQKSGVIVNVASKAALDHAAGTAVYSASKAAAVALMDSLAEEVRGAGVRVNSILPSIIDTPANRAAMPDADFTKWPKPEEIARVILFLCSEEAQVIHGAALPVYGYR